MVRLLGAIALNLFNYSVQVAKKWKGGLSPKCFEDVAAEFVDESHHLAGFRFGALAGQADEWKHEVRSAEKIFHK